MLSMHADAETVCVLRSAVHDPFRGFKTAAFGNTLFLMHDKHAMWGRPFQICEMSHAPLGSAGMPDSRCARSARYARDSLRGCPEERRRRVR